MQNNLKDNTKSIVQGPNVTPLLQAWNISDIVLIHWHWDTMFMALLSLEQVLLKLPLVLIMH